MTLKSFFCGMILICGIQDLAATHRNRLTLNNEQKEMRNCNYMLLVCVLVLGTGHFIKHAAPSLDCTTYHDESIACAAYNAKHPHHGSFCNTSGGVSTSCFSRDFNNRSEPVICTRSAYHVDSCRKPGWRTRGRK